MTVTKTRTLASRLLPARPLMALGAVGLSALVATTSGTAAAFTDTASAASSFGAISNFYPTPVVKDTSCKTVGGWLADDAKVSWDSLGKTPMGDDYTYEVVVRRDSNGNVKTRKNVGTKTSYTADINDTGRDYTVEIHTVNGPNKSTGWRGQRVQAKTVTITKCDGGERYVANPPGENVQTVTQDFSSKSMSMASAGLAADEPVDEQIDEPTTEAPDTTEATDDSVDTGSGGGSSSAGGGSAIVNMSASGNFVAAVTSSQLVITGESGSVVADFAVGEDAAVQWAADSDELWVVDSGELFLVGASSGWDKSAVDPESVELPVFIADLVQK
ncbi:hypothetical protein [Rhodococcus sp. WMMA185]|uniref:hypothetical protein n=1 Tax=Rhodococcus sp. WMMA185 TaxID=679318 RepID=UPI0018DE467D|nr:hypothetical protein [Rhodococcus sp. WMMA185]